MLLVRSTASRVGIAVAVVATGAMLLAPAFGGDVVYSPGGSEYIDASWDHDTVDGEGSSDHFHEAST